MRRAILALGLSACLAPLFAGEPALPTPALQAAVAQYRARRDGEAQAALEAIVRQSPECDAALFYLARLAKRRRDWPEMVDLCERCIELVPGNGLYWATLGEGYIRLAEKNPVIHGVTGVNKCRNALEKAVELEPNNILFRIGLLEFYKKTPRLLGGSMPKARAQAEAIKLLDPSAGWIALGGIALFEKDWAEAETDYRAAAAAQPTSIEPSLALARLQTERGEPDKALPVLRELLAKNPDNPGAQYYFGHTCLLAGLDLDAGEAAFRRYLAQPQRNAALPTHAQVLVELGELLVKRNAPAEARAAFEDALKLDPRIPGAAAGLKKLK